jgi:hypothetical protein
MIKASEIQIPENLDKKQQKHILKIRDSAKKLLDALHDKEEAVDFMLVLHQVTHKESVTKEFMINELTMLIHKLDKAIENRKIIKLRKKK